MPMKEAPQIVDLVWLRIPGHVDVDQLPVFAGLTVDQLIELKNRAERVLDQLVPEQEGEGR